MVCTTWEATYGSGAKIGITLRRNTVCCAVRHGTMATLTICLLRIASAPPLIIVTIVRVSLCCSGRARANHIQPKTSVNNHAKGLWDLNLGRRDRFVRSESPQGPISPVTY